MSGYLEAGNVKVTGRLLSRWNFLEDMLLIATGTATNGLFNKTSSIYGYYVNPKKTFDYLCIAAEVKIDTLWE